MYTTEINRLNDFYFKYLLGNEKRKNLTIHFLNAVLYGDETPHITDVVFILKYKYSATHIWPSGFCITGLRCTADSSNGAMNTAL